MRRREPLGILLLLLGCAAGTGCKNASGDIALAKSVKAGSDEVPLDKIPVPPADGPKLVALKSEVPVLEKPEKDAPVIGGLRFGARIARAKEPVRRSGDCEAGYYPIRPRGFVCGDPASVALDEANVASIPEPDVDRALPYRYAVVKSATVLYSRIPSVAEQQENEPSVERYLAKVAKATPQSLRAGSNDVPLDERGVASGRAVIAKAGQGVGEDGKRTTTSFFGMGLDMAAPAVPQRSDAPVVSMVLRRGSGVAVVGVTTAEGPSGPRKFGITPEALFVPLDRLEAQLGSTFFGVDLTKDKSLPVGFVLKHEVCPYSMGNGKAKRLEDEEYERRSVIHLTGRFRTVESVRYEEAEEGVWFRDKDLIKVTKRTKFPEFVTEGAKWIDLSLALQTLTLYEGRKPIYTTLVSSGKDVLGDPATSASTMQGTFTITRKAISTTLDPREVEQAFDVLDAPYALEFSPGFAIVGSYWGEPAGEARNFHNVTVTPVDAHRVFHWAGAEVPEGFRWFAPKAEETITVHVRK